jgi:hypothetical protein
MSMESITSKSMAEEEQQYRTATKGASGNRRRGGNESGSLDGSADALQLLYGYPERLACGFCGTGSLQHIMELVHWWLLSVWYQGEIHPLRLWMQPRFCSVPAPACY